MENIPGHRDHRSDDHDQLIGIIPERVIGMPGTLIGIVRNPQPGSNGRKPLKEKEKNKKNTADTGQLMEGLAALSE
jgi:hypothetical protein